MRMTRALACTALLTLLSSPSFAQEIIDITVGENVVVEDMNHHAETAGPDPSHQAAALPAGANLLASGADSTAIAHVTANDHQAAIATAKVGVKFDFLLPEGKTWEEVKDQPMWVTLKLDYDLTASFTPQTGSANAGLAIRPLAGGGPWYEFVGHSATGTPGSEDENEIALRFETTPQALGDTIELEAYAQAHATPGSGPNDSTASVTVHSITFDFVPKKSFTARLESKLFIGDIGWLDCGNPNFINPADYLPGAFQARRAAYQAFCQATSLGEDPPNGDIHNPLDARIRAGVGIDWTCEAGRSTPLEANITAIATEGGWEGPVKGVVNATAIRNNLVQSGTFGYVASGHPHPLVETAFQAFRLRNQPDIWQRITGSVSCDTNASGHPTAVLSTNIMRSPFPSHRLWWKRDANSAPRLLFDQGQGLFSQLWSLPAVPAP